MTNMEERIAALEKKQEEMSYAVEKLNAVEEIQYLMGRLMAWWQSPVTHHKVIELYANRDDSSHESFAGYHIGYDALNKYFSASSLPQEGTFYIHELTTPTIVVADDLKTARGMWMSPGYEAFGGRGKNGDPLPLWAWGKYNNDFIKVDGEWKIWHSHFYITFFTTYDTSWVDIPDDIRGGCGLIPGCKGVPDGVSNVYNPKGVFQGIPEAPRPYKTWSKERERP